MEINNLGQPVRMYIGEGPDRKLIGTAVVNEDGTVYCEIHDENAKSDWLLSRNGNFFVSEGVSFNAPKDELPTPKYILKD